MKIRHKHAQQGATLIEMVIAIVIMSIAMVGLFAGINAAASSSVDPVIQVKGIALGKSVIEDLHIEPFDNLQSRTWEQIRITKAGTRFLEIAEQGRFEINVQVSNQGLAGLPASHVKRIDIRIRHLAFPSEEGLLLTTYKTRLHDVLPVGVPEGEG